MNQPMKKVRRALRIKHESDKGFTLMEILVALAIVGIIVAITAAALGGRATTTRIESVAQQVAQVIQGRQQLFINDLRSADITMNEIASEIATVFANSTIVDTVAGTTGGTGLCATTGTDDGLTFTTVANSLSQEEAVTLQNQIRSAVTDIFDGAPAGGAYNAVFSNISTGVTAPLEPAAVPALAAGVATLYLCIDNA